MQEKLIKDKMLLIAPEDKFGTSLIETASFFCLPLGQKN
jgi:hypothetical protein